MAPLAAARPTIDGLIAAAPGRVGLVVKSLSTGETLAWSADERFPAASVIKLLVLVEALRQADAGRLALADPVPIRPEDRVGGTGILKELPSVRSLTWLELLTLMIVVSDNTATNVCIDRLGFDAINATAAALGLGQTRLERKMMDWEARASGVDNWTSASDAARLLERLATRRILTPAACDAALDILSRQQVRDRLPLRLPPDVRVAHKTGELPGVRHDVGVLFHDGDAVVIAALTSGFETPLGRGLVGGEACDLIAEIGRVVYDAVAAR